MEYKNAIFMCIEYIEKNIKEELTTEIIAKEIGYSTYHFSRIFKEQMGMSLMEYVKERRLICASKEIFAGKKIIDVSIEYGYKTHSGFSKAFKKKFGITPTLIHAIRISCCLINEKGGSYFMNDSSIFVKPSLDFTNPEALYENLVISIKSHHLADDLTMVERAYHLACKAHDGQYRKCGDPYVTHPLSVAIILAEMECDKESIIAGLLHDIVEENTALALEQVATEFSDEISQLIKEVTKLNIIGSGIKNKDNNMIDNRVILIKLADRLHNMRTLKYMEPEKWNEKAKETIEIFSPIATRLGISKIKTELDDLSLMYM